MKICFIAPGEISIPPEGWGALETVLWNQYSELKKLGVETLFINEQDSQKTLDAVSAFNPDVIHLHYGKHYDLMPKFNCRKIATNHDGSFRFSGAFHDAVTRRYLYDCEFFCLSELERRFFTQIGISKNKVKILPNGVDTKSFSVSDKPRYHDRSICVGKIDERKRQHILQGKNLNIDFVGAIATDKFDKEDSSYLGSWTGEQIRNNLTEYANLVLLSTSENCCPLVCLEAMAAGLGIVISEACTESIDLQKKFITVIPEDKVNDCDYVHQAIQENRKISLGCRPEILNYISGRDWSNIAKIYKGYL